MAIGNFLTNLHLDCCQAIKDNFDWPSDCVYYPDAEAVVTTPKIHFAVAEWSIPDSQNGTGELRADLVCDLTLIFDPANVSSPLDIRNAAMDVSYFIHGNTLTNGATPAQVMAVKPEINQPNLSEYLVWTVRFQQRISIGTSEWDDDGVTPTEVNFAYVENSEPGNDFETLEAT